MTEYKNESVFVLCPKCGAKTRTQIRKDTVLKNFPLFCPKCKENFLIEAQNMKIKNFQTIIIVASIISNNNIYCQLILYIFYYFIFLTLFK